MILLVAQLNSIRRPAIILASIPLAMIGVTVGLLLLKSYFGFMTLLGIISLAGIVINNAIVLIDRIKIEIEVNGLEPSRAIIEATQRRLRPILLTTATTVGVSREWAAARKSKDEYWRERVARLGPIESFRISGELRQQALLQHPGWPHPSDRREDILSHVHFSELLRRASSARRP